MTVREQVRWTTPDIEKEKSTLSFQVAEIDAQDGVDAVRDFLQSRISYLESAESPEDQLKRFVSIIFMLDWHNRFKMLASPQIGQLADTARNILKAYGIHPETSKLSWMYGEIELVLAQSRRREGRFFEATWHSGMALYHSRKGGIGDPGFQYLISAMRAVRLGNFDLAFEAFVKTELTTKDPGQKLQARVNRVQILRLLGKYEEASYLIDQTSAIREVPFAVQLELNWERYCLDALEHGNLIGIINAVGRNGSHRHPSYMLESTLWVKCFQSKAFLGKVPRAESIKRAFPGAINRNSVNYLLYECAHQLDLCYDNEIPILVRLNDLGRCLSQASRLITLDKELLFWGAAARWLGRYHQPMMAVFCSSEYKALSLRISGGQSADSLKLNLDYSPWGRKELTHIDKEAIAAPLDSIAATKMDRVSTISKLTFGLASAKIRSRFRQTFASPENAEQIIADEYQEIGDLLIQAIGAMKGPAVKIAQLISFTTPNLPAPIVEALKKSQDATHPVNTDLIVQVIESSLERPLAELFESFDRVPVAAASIGQIHRATLPDGTLVAVKAQYPGIKDVIKADMRLIRMMKFLFRRIFPSANVEEVIDCSEKALYEECDYRREATFQTSIGDHYRQLDEIIIPRIYQDISTDRVLVMDFIEGRTFSEFKEQASSEEKQRAGLVIYRYALDSFFNYGIYNADPHPGNYLFTDDGRVCFLDFGFAESFPEERRDIWRTVVLALIDCNGEQLCNILTTLGFITDPTRLDMVMINDLLERGFGYLKEGKMFRYDEAFIKQVMFMTTIGTNSRRFVKLPVIDNRLLRFFWCLHAILGELGVEANWREILLEILNKKPLKSQAVAG